MTKILDEPFNALTAWVSESSSASIVAGRNGTAMQLTTAGPRRYDIAAGVQNTTLTVGFACTLNTLASAVQVLMFRMGATPGANNNVVFVNTNGSVDVRRGTGTVLGTSAAGLVTANTWFYLEAKIFHANSGGTYTVRVNNTQVINGSGDTNNAQLDTEKYSAIALAGGTSTTVTFDDLYLSNGDPFEGDHAIGAAKVKTWNGSAFVDAPVKVYNGTAWVDALAVKTWNGSAWV